jgi:hypothetical protein
MAIQHQFAYAPQWKYILYFFAVGLALLLLGTVQIISFKAGLALSILPLALAVAAAVRRALFPRSIELGQDTLLVHTGFLQLRARRIALADIEGAWEGVRGKTNVLTLRTKTGSVELNSIMFRNRADYVAARDAINSVITPKEKPPWTPAERGKYCFRCSYEGSGEVYDSNGEVLWRVETQHPGMPSYPYGFFRLPDFVVYDRAGTELFRVKRVRKWLMARFVMVSNGMSICSITQRSPLLNRYRIDFADGQVWGFRMPLFTVYSKGSSTTGANIRVRLWSHNVWYVLIESEVENPPLVAALAFIHREHLRRV